jgi:hypothetical protein
MDKCTLRLTITVEYDNPSNEEAYLRDNLYAIAKHAYDYGMITEDAEATINSWNSQVESVIPE